MCTFGMLPLIMYWAVNLGQVRAEEAYKPFLITVVSVWLLFHIFLPLLRSLAKTSLLMLLLIFVFFTYGHLAMVLPEGSLLAAPRLFIIYSLLFLSGTFLIFRTKLIPESVITYFQFLTMFLLIFNIVKILEFDPRYKVIDEIQPIAITGFATLNTLPDVYYIVLDAYARDDVLKEVYDLDNSDFINELRSRGFYIPDCAMSNYEHTMQTIPSVLNMNYLGSLGITDRDLSSFKSPIINLTLNNQVSKTFQAMGYQFVTARGWAAFNDITDSDIYLNYYYSIGEPDLLAEKTFGYNFWNTTLIHAYSDLSPDMVAKAAEANQPGHHVDLLNMGLEYEKSIFWYNQTKYVFQSLKELPQSSGGPYLVYAHINSPHGPYVFNQDGSFRFAPDLNYETTYYGETIQPLNEMVLDMIDTVIANSDIPPVIVLQADHGTHYFTNGINKHKILSAYYLPGDIDLIPYSTITPVNNFRLILHDYFDPSIILLPDVLYVMGEDGYQSIPASCNITP